jgi:hypothetical protein
MFNVMIAAEGVRQDAAERAAFMSDFGSGELVVTVRPVRGTMLLAVRTRATAV